MLIGDLLRRAAERLPGKAALIDGERSLTFAELDREADRCAAALAAAHARGERIGILAPNCAGYAIAYFGSARAGTILAGLSTRSTAAEIAFMVAKVGIARLLVAPEFAATVAAALPGGSRPPMVALGPGADGEPWDGFLARASGAAPAAPAPADPFSITFTGGTTGRPKAALATHAARYATAVTCGVEFGLDERDVLLVATPMFHAAGLYVWFQTGIMLGCTCVLLPAWDPAQAIALIARHRCTGVLLVPTQIRDLIQHPDCTAGNLASLRHLHYAGAPMPLALLDRAQAALPHVGFTENYGQSESGGPMAIRRPFHPHAKRGTIGRPCHNVETRVVDATGAECAVGVPGEIVSRGPHLFSRYWDDPEQTAAAFRPGGWLGTGDIGVRDEDGFIALVDRARDMIVSGGENLFPSELEAALSSHPAVAECAVFGIPDERWGEVPAAHVVLRAGMAATPAGLADHCERATAHWKRLRLVEIVAGLPRSGLGKVQKAKLRAPFWEGRERKI